MKKLLSMAILMLSMLGSGSAHALLATEGTQLANTAQSAISAMNDAITSAATFATEVKTSIMEAWDKSAWMQQLKGLWESIGELKKNVNELMGLRDDVMNTFSGLRNTHITDYKSMGDKSVDYSYAAQLPRGYVGAINCDADGSCSSSSNYSGKASGIKSEDIRKAWHVPEGLIEETDVRKLSYEAAEEYAQQIAVIQAIAQEAYVQATNRVAKIEELQQKLDGAKSAVNTQSNKGSAARDSWNVSTDSINLNHSGSSAATDSTLATINTVSFSGGASSYNIGSSEAGTAGNGNPASTDPNKNDLKYIADLQARIQVEQALLVNDQNKLASLAILQQSATDAYEQRKKEIASYAVRGGGDGGLDIGGIVTRGLVGAAQTAAYGAVVAAYQ